VFVGTRKMASYGQPGRSQGKPWWRIEAVLTCKSFVGAVCRGERPIESWVTFSSTRSATSLGKEQLYVAGITVDSMGNIKTYAPIYLWNQSDTVNNLIPSWGEFSLPMPTIIPPPPPLPPPPQ